MSRSKKIALWWFAITVLSSIVLMIGVVQVKNVRTRNTKDLTANVMSGWERSTTGEKDENGNYIISYKNTLGDIAKDGESLMFFAYHGDVYVYSENQLMYSMQIDTKGSFFKPVPGDAWNCIFVSEQMSGKTVEVFIHTEYASYLEYEPTFYLGDRATIIKNELMSSIMNLVVVFVMFLVGVIVIAYSVFSARNRTNSYSLVYLGVFAVMLAMWFFINMPVINMVFDLGTIFTYMSYIILGSITVPLILFEKRLMEDKYSRACDALCMFNVVAQLIIYGLQLFGIKDMKETLIVTHVAIGVSAVVLVTLLVIDFITVGWKNLNGICKLNMLCGLLTAVGVGFDIVYYYININSGRNYLFTKIFFLIHVVSLCCYSMNETRKLMSKGKEAQKYEKLAYRDELTGVFNRTACNNDMKKMDLTEDKYTVIMFDLNNLKKCNDTLGHNFGDDYIISSARYIKESFEGVGKCYRIGGDEFSVIGKNTSDEVIELCYKEMQKRIDEYNSINKEINMSIAFGYAVYDPEVDEDLKDTRGRADGLMYKNKMNMKEKIN